MYEVEDDKLYCYPGTTVLKNKLDLKDAAELAAFEAEISSQRATEPLPEGRLDAARRWDRRAVSGIFDELVAQCASLQSEVETRLIVRIGANYTEQLPDMRSFKNISKGKY